MPDFPPKPAGVRIERSKPHKNFCRAGRPKLSAEQVGRLPVPPECSDELRDSELLPQAEGHPCGDRDGNLIFRTICNMPEYDMAAISLPASRAAACFGIEALRGEISFEIVAEDGTHIWDTMMGKAAYDALKLDGAGVWHIKATGGSPDGAVTVSFVDVSDPME